MIQVKSKNITTANFKEYGEVVNLPDVAPTSEDIHYQFWSDIASYEIAGETEVGICKVFRKEQSIISGMERHLKTPEILIPIDAPFLLPLNKDNDDDSQAVVFKVAIGQAVIINPAIWHGACIPLGQKESSYFVIFRRGTPVEDVYLRDTQKIELVGP